MRLPRRLLLAGSLVPLLIAGCNFIKAIGLQMAPTSEKVPPEFNRLAGKKVVVFVWADREILWDYPKVTLDLASYVSAYLEKNVKGVTPTDPLRVESYLEQINRFEADPIEVGRHFNAEMVVELNVYQFSMRDPGLSQFYRGRVGSSVVVEDLTNPNDPQRIALKDVNVAVPPEGPLGYANARPEQVRQETYDAFAAEVGKKFHEWQRPIG